MRHSINVTIEAPYCPVWWWAWEHCDTGPLVPGLETGQIKMGDVITDPPRLIVVPDSTNNNTGELGLLRGGQTTHTKLLWRSPLPNSGLGTVPSSSPGCSSWSMRGVCVISALRCLQLARGGHQHQPRLVRSGVPGTAAQFPLNTALFSLITSKCPNI